MAKLTREKKVDLGNGGSITVKKWSTVKLLRIMGLLSAIGKDSLHGIYDRETEKFNPLQIASNILAAIGENTSLIIDIVNESVPGSTAEDVGEWDPEDLLDVLTEILDLNLTETLGKKLSKFLGTFLARSSEVVTRKEPRVPAKKKETDSSK